MAALDRHRLTLSFVAALIVMFALVVFQASNPAGSQSEAPLVITIGESGFDPPDAEVLAGSEVTIRNATGQTQILGIGDVRELWLPLVGGGGRGGVVASARGAEPQASPDAAIVTLAPGQSITRVFEQVGGLRLKLLTRPFRPIVIAVLRGGLVRGYIATAVVGREGTQGGLQDVFLPQVKVYLKNTASLSETARVTTDLSGRFTLEARAGRYQICWEASGFVPGCTQQVFTVVGRNLHVSTQRIAVDRSDKTTVVFGKVSMLDGSRVRLLDPIANVNAFARVQLLDAGGTQLFEALVNNFDEYLLPKVPPDTSLRLRVISEGGVGEQALRPQANLGGAPFHPINLTLGNNPPRLDPPVPTDGGGRFVRAALPGQLVSLGASGQDPDNDPLQYRWTLAGGAGTLNTTSGPNVQWTLPNRPGLYTLDVVAFDGKGGYARSSVALRADSRGVLFSGFVDGTDVAAIPGARVEVNGKPTTTDGRGWFELYVPDADRFVLNIRKEGYGLASRIYDKSVSGGRWTLTRATTQVVDPTKDIVIQDRRETRDCPGPGADSLNWRSFPELLQNPQWQDGKGSVIEPPERQLPLPLPKPGRQRECGPGIGLFIPANALQNSAGVAATAPVTIDLTTIDLESPEQMPGDYSVRPLAGGVQVMQSYGAGMVEIYAGGSEFNLKPGATAVLTIPVDPSQLTAGGPIPPTIPILFYDEVNGIWVEEGSAALNGAGTAYIAQLSHFSAINADTLKNDQACVRVLSPSLPASYELEVQVPQGGGAAPKVLHATITNTPPHQHVIYNLPINTNIVLVPVPVGFDPLDDINPFGVFVVNTGGAQNPTTPNQPAGPPYVACSTEVVLSQLSIPDEPESGEFLHGLYTFAATRLEEASPGVPISNALNTALISATNAYYDQIDPRNLRETLQEFREANGYTTTTEVRAVYANRGDLGFGRDMHCAKKLADDLQYDVACYVTNYGSIDTPDEQDAEDAADPLAPAVATVAMEYSRIEDPGADGAPIVYGDPQRVVKFYVYNGAGDALLQYANLDGLGLRPIPQLCQVCHSGEAPNVAAPSGPITSEIPVFLTRNDVKLGSRFIPFDLKYYAFGGAPFTKAAQQDEFRLLNEDIVSRTLPGPAVSEVIAEMYDPGPNQDETFVVAGWNSGPLTQTTYREVVAPTCRMCHTTVTYAPSLNLQTSSQAVDLLAQIESRVCVQHVMPHARATHRIFWRSFDPSMPATLQLFGDAFGAGTGWNGELCGDFTPGGDTPVSFYEANIQPIFNNNGCIDCHAGAAPPAGLNLTADESYADLVNVNSLEVPGEKRVAPGDAASSYLHEKISDDTPAVGERMPPASQGYAPLSAADIATITNWINSGAAP
jgi:hypothetical protein